MSKVIGGRTFPVCYPFGSVMAEEHCLGNTRSNYTSWTMNPWTALSFATNQGRNDGIVLVKVFNFSEIIVRTAAVCLDHQWELQIEGPVTGAVPIPVTKDMLNVGNR